MIKRKIEQQKQKAAATTKPTNGSLSYLEQNQLTTMAYKALLDLAANRLSDIISHYFSVHPLPHGKATFLGPFASSLQYF